MESYNNNGDNSVTSYTMSSSPSSSTEVFQTPTEAFSSVSITNESIEREYRESGNGTLGPLGLPPKTDKRRTFR